MEEVSKLDLSRSDIPLPSPSPVKDLPALLGNIVESWLVNYRNVEKSFDEMLSSIGGPPEKRVLLPLLYYALPPKAPEGEYFPLSAYASI